MIIQFELSYKEINLKYKRVHECMQKMHQCLFIKAVGHYRSYPCIYTNFSLVACKIDVLMHACLLLHLKI